MWLIFSIGAAVFDASRDAIGKNGLQKTNLGPYTISWGLTFFGACFMLPLLFIFGVPELNPRVFWTSLLLAGIIHVFSTANYFTAIKITDLSLAGPITCFTPLFLLVLSPLFTGISGQDATKELPNIIGILGVSMVVGGSYIINLKEKKKGYLAPIKAIFLNQGSRRVLLSAFMWSITISLDKVAMTSLRPDNDFQRAFFWGFLLLFTVSTLTLPFVYMENQKAAKENQNQGQKPPIPQEKKKLSRMLKETAFSSQTERKPKLKQAAEKWYQWKTWLGWLGVKKPELEGERGQLKTMLSSYKKPQPETEQNWYRWKILVGVGLSNALITICHMMAVSLGVAAYAIAVKRLAIIFKVLIGAFIFKETNLKERVVGASIMVLGVACISFASLR